MTARNGSKPSLREQVVSSTTFHSASDVPTDFASGTLVKNWWLLTLRGVAGIILGCPALIFPGPMVLSLVILFSAYMLVDGVIAAISAVRAARRNDRWGLLVFEGFLDIAVGIGAFSLRPDPWLGDER